MAEIAIDRAALGMILERLDAQDKILTRIEAKVDKTNGRVTDIETREAIAEGIRKDRATQLRETAERSEGQRDRRVVLQAAVLGGTFTVLVFVIALILRLAFHISI